VERLTIERAQAYTRDGFVLERGLLTCSEVDAINDAFMRMHASGGVPGRYEPPPPEQDYDDGVHYMFENLIHGSQPNTSRDRFRRSLICHFVPRSTIECHPSDELCDRWGRAVTRAHAEGGGPCGTPYEFAP
jgi:hypothetical protein